MPRLRSRDRRGSCAAAVAVLGRDALGMELHAVDRQLACASPMIDAVGGARGDRAGRPAGSPARRPASGSGSPRTARAGRANRPSPSCSIGLSLPCIDLPARGRCARRRPGRSPGGRGRRRAPADAGGGARPDRARCRRGRDRRGPGEITMPSRPQRQRLLGAQRIVAPHLDLGAQLAQVVEQVVGEAVVVIEQEQHRIGRARGPVAARAVRPSAKRARPVPSSGKRARTRRQGGVNHAGLGAPGTTAAIRAGPPSEPRMNPVDCRRYVVLAAAADTPRDADCDCRRSR